MNFIEVEKNDKSPPSVNFQAGGSIPADLTGNNQVGPRHRDDGLVTA